MLFSIVSGEQYDSNKLIGVSAWKAGRCFVKYIIVPGFICIPALKMLVIHCSVALKPVSVHDATMHRFEPGELVNLYPLCQYFAPSHARHMPWLSLTAVISFIFPLRSSCHVGWCGNNEERGWQGQRGWPEWAEFFFLPLPMLCRRMYLVRSYIYSSSDFAGRECGRLRYILPVRGRKDGYNNIHCAECNRSH